MVSVCLALMRCHEYLILVVPPLENYLEGILCILKCGSVMGYNPGVTLSSNFHFIYISVPFYRAIGCLFLNFTALVTLPSNCH